MKLGVIAAWRGGVLALGLAVLAGCTSQGPLAPMDNGKPDLPVSQPKRVPKFGLALGGGAARGFAHVGVIKALEAQGIRPDIVVGSSAGSGIAALLASGATGNDLNRLALNLDEATIADWGRGHDHGLDLASAGARLDARRWVVALHQQANGWSSDRRIQDAFGHRGH